MNYSSATGNVSPSGGAITLAEGNHVINLKGKTNGGEYLRPRTLTLTPQ